MSTTNFNTISSASDREIGLRASFGELFRRCPIPQSELLDNVGLFARRQLLSRIFWMAELYRKILPVQGVVMEFGVRWGQNLVLFHSFRGMWEPFNYSRKIVGFDTFGGFPSEAIDNADGGGAHVVAGGHGVSEAYELISIGYSNTTRAKVRFHMSESIILLRAMCPRPFRVT